MSEPPTYLVRGNDGKDYGADRATVLEWIRAGRVSPSQLVYYSVAGRWDEARNVPDLREAFLRIGTASRGTAQYAPNYAGRVLVFIGIVVAIAWAGHFLFTFPIAASFGLCAWFAASRKAKPISLIVGPGTSSSNNALLLSVATFSLIVGAGVDAAERYFNWRTDVEARERATAAAEQQKREADDETAALRANATAFAAALTDGVQRVKALDASGDIRKAHSELNTISTAVEPYVKLDPIPPTLAAPIASYRETKDRVEAKFSAAEKLDNAGATQKRARSLITSKDWLLADDAIGQALAAVEGVSTSNAEKMRLELTAMRKRIKSRVDRAGSKEQEKEMYLTLCGPKPYRSGWDGEVGNIERELKKVAHDPSSIDVENCTEPYLNSERCWVTACDVRGKNAFGGLVLTRKRFSISKLGIDEID